ncbi:MAG: hypothetical protein J6A22_06450 [Bacteroidales bacterium]|nr:hypothetical protein [Bacteroidales bacterium]
MIRKGTMTSIIAVLAVILSANGCKEYNVEEILLLRDDISLTVKGETVISYDATYYQLGFNVQRNEFRVHDDAMANFFILTCSEVPSAEGEVIYGDIIWTGTTRTYSETGLQFSVEKTDDTGLIWLWNTSKKIGVVIKDLR